MAQPHWSVEFYTDARGDSPVLDFLRSLSKAERAVAARDIALLEEFGLYLTMPHARRINDVLYELRSGPNRLFYFAYVQRRLVILHGFRKKSQRTPQQEIAAAMRRWGFYVERENER